MSRGYARFLTGLDKALTFPLSTRQRAKTLARAGETLIKNGHRTLDTKNGPIHVMSGQSANTASMVETFFDDEPETLDYIDDFVSEGDVFWDIGANIGLYAIYAAQRKANVYAFEPSGLNFGILIQHIYQNKMGKRIKPFCIALSDKDGMDDLNMAEFNIGHASNALGVGQNQFDEFDSIFTQTVIAMTGDSFAKTYDCYPKHIKLDVDGIEPLILRGMPTVLSQAESLLIEVEGVNRENKDELFAMLEDKGLKETSIDWGKGKQRNYLFTRS